MNIETRKISLINWLSRLSDEKLISKIESLQQQETDWWNTISEDERKAIDEGIAQLERGEYYTHEEVRSRIKERFNF